MDRTKTEIYANMLTLQADMAMPFERPFFENENWTSADNVFDLGCGNAHYLKKLALLFPNKQYFGFEIDEQMRKEAKTVTARFENITLIESVEELEDVKIDFFLFRLVLLHLKERSFAYDTIAKFGSEKKTVLIIDAEDEHFKHTPVPHKFLDALGSLRSKSVDRNLFEKVDEEMNDYGLQPTFSQKIIINSSFPHASELMFKYMYYTAELGIGSPLPDEIKTDLLEWWLHPQSYIQYGIFGKLFTK